MFSALMKFFGFNKKKVEQTELMKSLGKGICPDCKGKLWLFGPHGGMNQCIKCANENCNSEFCVGPFDDGWCGLPMYAERVK
jgi:hypothetical protein